MSRTYIPKVEVENYIYVKDISEALKRMLGGEKAEVGRGCLNILIELLKYAHSGFYGGGFAIEPRHEGVMAVSANCLVREVLTTMYEISVENHESETTKELGDILRNEERLEEEVRSLLYFAESIPRIWKLPPRPIKKYQRLQEFCQVLGDKAGR